MGRGLAGLLALGLLGGCAPPAGVRVEGPARPSVSVRQVLVLDYGNHPGSQPQTLWLDEITAVVELRWSEWGGEQAAATGVVVPATCADPSCLGPQQQPDRVPVRLVLDQPVQRGDTRYYSHAALSRSGPQVDWISEYGSVRLPVPAA